MQLSEQAKKNILNTILYLISFISSIKDYGHLWIKGLYGMPFDELCCDFFGDCDPLLENYQDFGLTEKQYQILKTFRDEFEAFSDENSWPPFFINSPEWAHIMERAREVLKVFHFEKKDPEGSS